MQRMILSEKTVAVIAQRLMHFYKGVVRVDYFGEMPIFQVLSGASSQHDPLITYAGNVEVQRWKATSKFPAGFGIDIDRHLVGEGRQFYFMGNRTIIIAGDPGEYGGVGAVKLTLASSRKCMTEDQVTRAWTEQGDRDYDKMFMDETADRMQEVSDLQREDADNQRRADEELDRMLERDY